MLSVLDEKSFAMEDFDARVVSLGTVDEFIVIPGSRVDVGFGTAWQIPMGSSGMSEAVPQLAHQLLLQRLGNYSIWWGHGSKNVSSSMLVCAGMPQISDFSAMMNGDWSSGNWEQWPGNRVSDEL